MPTDTVLRNGNVFNLKSCTNASQFGERSAQGSEAEECQLTLCNLV